MAQNINNIMTDLRLKSDKELQDFAAEHKNDPFMFPLAFQESQTRKHVRAAEQAKMAGMEQPKVVDQDLMQMSPPQAVSQQMPQQMPQQVAQLPENMGIGQIPAPNLQKLAGGGIVAFEEGGEVPRFSKGGLNEYQDQIISEAKRLGIDPDVAMNLFETESGGNKNAVSGKGAAGLGQLMKPAAQEMGLTEEERFDPTKNITASLGYFKKQLDRFGDYEKAAAAYNWGPGNVNKHLAKNDGILDRLSLPKETANYLTKLMPGRDAVAAERPEVARATPDKGFGLPKGAADFLTNLIPVGSAYGAEDTVDGRLKAQQQALQAQQAGQKDDARGVGKAVGLGTVAGTMGAGMGIPVVESTKAIYPSGTTARQALTQLGRAASVPAAVGIGGLQASGVARNNLELMSPEQRQQLASNPMLSAMSGDTGLAGAIMNAGQEEKDRSSKMSYWDQMANVGKFLVGHPDARKGAAKEEAKKEAAKPYDFTQFDKATDAYMAERDAKKSLTDIAVDANKAAKTPAPAPAAAADTSKDGLAALFNNPAFLMGMRLMGSQNPSFLGGVSEAGIGTAGDLMAQRKMDTEDTYRKAYARYLDESAGSIARGAKEKNETQLAEKTAQDYYDTWSKNNKMALMTNPALGEQVRQQLRKEAYDAFKLPFPSAAGAGAPKADPLGILSKG